MQLTVDSLNKSGGFAGGPVKKEVEWEHNGEMVKADVWIRPMSYHTAVKDISAYQSGADIIAHRLALCVCHEDGSPVFQYSDITGYKEDDTLVMVKEAGGMVERGPLNKQLADALMVLVSEVSGLGKKMPNSPGKKSSGTNSS